MLQRYSGQYKEKLLLYTQVYFSIVYLVLVKHNVISCVHNTHVTELRYVGNTYETLHKNNYLRTLILFQWYVATSNDSSAGHKFNLLN